jgi:hypothetical protein
MPHFVEFGLIYVVQISGFIPNGRNGASQIRAHDHSYVIDGEGLTEAEQAEITATINAKLQTLTYNHGLTRNNFKAFRATKETGERFEANWRTKRQRGDSYHMNLNNDWYKQMDYLQSLLTGKTAAEIEVWYKTYFDYTGIGRPLPLPGESDPQYAEIKKIRSPDAVSGVTLSLADGHGNIIGAVLMAIANAKQ